VASAPWQREQLDSYCWRPGLGSWAEVVVIEKKARKRRRRQGILCKAIWIAFSFSKIPIKRDRREACPQASPYSPKVLVRKLPILSLIVLAFEEPTGKVKEQWR